MTVDAARVSPVRFEELGRLSRPSRERLSSASATLDSYLSNDDMQGLGTTNDNWANNDCERLQAQIVAYAKTLDGELQGFWLRIAQYIRELLGIEDPHVLRRHGVSSANLRCLTPAQAVLLAQQIVADALTYYHALAEVRHDGTRSKKIQAENDRVDSLGIDVLLREEKRAVCRHYAFAVEAVFRCLKELQDPAQTQLNNVYMKVVHSREHAWNACFIVQPDRHVLVAQVDAMWNDLDVQRRSRENDYTYGPRTEDAPEGVRWACLKWAIEANTAGVSVAAAVCKILRTNPVSAAEKKQQLARLSQRWDGATPAERDAFWHVLPKELQAGFKRYRAARGLDNAVPVLPSLP